MRRLKKRWDFIHFSRFHITYISENPNISLIMQFKPYSKFKFLAMQKSNFYLHLALNEKLMLLLICIKGRSSSRQCSLISQSLTLMFVWVRFGVWREGTVSRWILLPTVSSLEETVTWSSTVTNREAGSSISFTPGKSITCL